MDRGLYNRLSTGIDMDDIAFICKSEYVAMRDGVLLAVSMWLPREGNGKFDKYTAVVTTTRYWRARALHRDNPEFYSYYSLACYLLAHGYVLVAADARGSGASFGFRETEISSAEVEDIGELIEWASRQSWCDGQVVTEGTSYTANTTLCSLVTAPSALKIGVCRAPDFDLYRHLFAPGGIPNYWFIKAWGEATDAQDNNDAKALYSGAWLPPKCGADHIVGVRPVDSDRDGVLLAAAIEEHQSNYNVADNNDKLMYVDQKLFGSHRFLFDPVYKQRIEKGGVPAVIHCG